MLIGAFSIPIDKKIPTRKVDELTEPFRNHEIVVPSRYCQCHTTSMQDLRNATRQSCRRVWIEGGIVRSRLLHAFIEWFSQNSIVILRQQTNARGLAQSTMDYPILIVGAGPAGATTALHLARLGVKSLVISSHRGTANTPRAHVLNQRAMEVLRDANLEGRLRQIATSAESRSSDTRCFGLLTTNEDRHATYMLARFSGR